MSSMGIKKKEVMFSWALESYLLRCGNQIYLCIINGSTLTHTVDRFTWLSTNSVRHRSSRPRAFKSTQPSDNDLNYADVAPVLSCRSATRTDNFLLGMPIPKYYSNSLLQKILIELITFELISNNLLLLPVIWALHFLFACDCIAFWVFVEIDNGSTCYIILFFLFWQR
jgi:hypothetical protein